MPHRDDPDHRPRLSGDAASSAGADRPGAGELPIVEGGGIPDLGESGISELEAAAMLAGFDDEPQAPHERGPTTTPGARSHGLEAIPMAEVAPAPHHPAHPDDPSTIPLPHEAAGGGDGNGNGQAGRFRAIGVKAKRHEDDWARTPNVTGTGAIHVRTFMSKLTEDGFHALDARVNEWLDAHPQYEVKFVNTSIGTVTGKSKEAQLICQVWV